ncbi:MAG TPA: AtpZ/AtpI family protein [Stellaceae bacterium]|nr:AtpZ/AtpI family protein [Stellaceae bacterium]
MTGPETPDPLAGLEARIAKAKSARARQSGDDALGSDLPKGALGLAFRIGVELVAALVVSLTIGWLLDRWLGTRPWLMVAFFFAGSAAGMLNVYRAASGMGLAVGYRRGEPDDDGQNGQDRGDDRR